MRERRTIIPEIWQFAFIKLPRNKNGFLVTEDNLDEKPPLNSDFALETRHHSILAFQFRMLGIA